MVDRVRLILSGLPACSERKRKLNPSRQLNFSRGAVLFELAKGGRGELAQGKRKPMFIDIGKKIGYREPPLDFSFAII